MGLNYERMHDKANKPLSENERMLVGGGDFPDCVGFYPDCPEKPSLMDSKCRNCPKIDYKMLPRLAWVDCEYCKEDGVPYDVEGKIGIGEDTFCHICGKLNTWEHINSLKNS